MFEQKPENNKKKHKVMQLEWAGLQWCVSFNLSTSKFVSQYAAEMSTLGWAKKHDTSLPIGNASFWMEEFTIPNMLD